MCLNYLFDLSLDLIVSATNRDQKIRQNKRCTQFLGLSEPEFYGDLVYKLKKIVGSNNFSAQFIKIISHYKKIGYNINVLQNK